MLKYCIFSISFIVMYKKEEILLLLSNSQLFTHEMKQQLELFFDSLNQNQIEFLSQALESEKVVLLAFLKSLKHKEVIEYTQLKTIKEGIYRNKRKLIELEEQKKNNAQLDDLLLMLDNI